MRKPSAQSGQGDAGWRHLPALGGARWPAALPGRECLGDLQRDVCWGKMSGTGRRWIRRVDRVTHPTRGNEVPDWYSRGQRTQKFAKDKDKVTNSEWQTG